MILMKRFYALLFLSLFVLNPAWGGDGKFYRIVSSQDTAILDFSIDDSIQWSNAVVGAECRVEKAPFPAGPWSGDFLPTVTPHSRYCSADLPAPGGVNAVHLSIFSNGWGSLLDERWVASNSSGMLAIDEGDHGYDGYYFYQHCDGYYTEIDSCQSGDVVRVNLDLVPTNGVGMTGVLIAESIYFSDWQDGRRKMEITAPGSSSQESLATDADGRYVITNQQLGVYRLDFIAEEVDFVFNLTNTTAVDYRDLSYVFPLQAAAPNVYLYPETAMDISVQVDVAYDGVISTSTPPYNIGWNVHVDPDGTVDSVYDYLFYEASIPFMPSCPTGWLLNGANLEQECRDLLLNIGFVGREIDDFVEYWMPIISGHPYYAFYWHPAEDVSSLTINPPPTNLLRAHFVIHPLPVPLVITAPVLPTFQRNGYTVVEWGVYGWDAH